jgi:hypothetical protein
MSVDKIEVWIRRLRDSDSEIRRDAIRQLELIGDPAVLGALAAVFALDTDLETRKLAQRVGKSIYTTAQTRLEMQKGASEEERQRAADILAKAQAKKQGKNNRGK